MGPFVTITAEAVARSKRDAAWHVARAKRKKWNGVGYDGPNRGRDNFGGYCAEEAVAALMGIAFKRDLNGFHKADVGPWSVRFGTVRGYGLVIHDRDGPQPYVLVTPGHLEREFEIVGWLRRAEALDLQRAGIGRQLQGTTHPWLIPPEYLRPWGAK
jgi:hypothetical protein